jgi:hypothetical protein
MKKETQVIEMENTKKNTKKNTKETLRKRSEVLAEHKALMEENEKLVTEMQKREYTVNFKNKTVYNRFYKFLEKDCEWGHTTAAGLIMLFNNVKVEKEKTKDDDWNGDIVLRSVNVSTLWQMLTTMKGNGFYEAKNFVELMAVIGQPISEAVKQVHEDNQALRDAHEKLSKLDQLLSYGDLIEDVETEEMVSETESATE